MRHTKKKTIEHVLFFLSCVRILYSKMNNKKTYYKKNEPFWLIILYQVSY